MFHWHRDSLSLLRPSAVTAACLVLTGVVGAMGQRQPIALNVEWKSKYVGLSGGTFHERPVLQSSLTAALASGFYAEVFHSGEASRHYLDNENGWATEADYTLGWNGRFKSAVIAAKMSYCDGARLFCTRGDGVNSSVQIARRCVVPGDQSVSSFVKMVDYHTVDGAPWNGFRVFVGVHHSAKLTPWLASDSTAAVAYDDGAFGNSPGFIGSISTAFSFRIGKAIRLGFPLIDLYSPLQSLTDDRRPIIVLGCRVNNSI